MSGRVVKTSNRHRRPSSLEIDFRAFAAADPVALLFLDRLGPVDQLQIVQQPLGVGGDPQNPLAERAAVDVLVAFAVAGAVGVDLFVGEHGLAAFAPPDRHFGFVGEAFLEELEENPLRPFEVFGVGGVDFAVPVVGEAEHLDLAAERVDVLLAS